MSKVKRYEKVMMSKVPNDGDADRCQRMLRSKDPKDADVKTQKMPKGNDVNRFKIPKFNKRC